MLRNRATRFFHWTPPTCVKAAALVLEVVDFAGPAAGFGASTEVDKGETLVLSQRGEVEVFGAEEEQRVEQHYGRVGAQLLTLPQVGLFNARGNSAACRREEEAGETSQVLQLLNAPQVVANFVCSLVQWVHWNLFVEKYFMLPLLRAMSVKTQRRSAALRGVVICE